MSTNRRYHDASRSIGRSRVGNALTGKRGAWLLVSLRDEREPVHERERTVGVVEGGQQVRHRDEHREARAPAAVAVRRAEVDAGAHDLGRAHARVEQAEHRLGDDERDAVLETFAQPRLQVTDRVGVGARSHHDRAVAHVGVEAARVVGPEVERAARHEVEARVVPVARDEAGFDRALVQREAEVRAAILDRVRPRRRARTRRPAASRPW